MTLLCALFFAATRMGWQEKGTRVQMLILLVLTCGVSALYLCRDKLRGRDLLAAGILLAGVVMRVGYALYTPAAIRSHDLGLASADASGHAAYIVTLFETAALPTNNEHELGQPPLYYLAAALVMKLYHWVTGLTNVKDLLESVRFVSCAASIGTLFVCEAIGRELELDRRATRILLTVCAFLPVHYLLAGLVNQDSLAVFWIACILLLALRWRREQSLKTTLLLALCFGLGMMTKLTVAALALPVGVLMAAWFWKRCIKQRRWEEAKKLLLFLLVAVPLGMGYPVRNAILYGQPLNGVFQLAVTDYHYVGGASLWARYGLFNPVSLFFPLYIDWNTNVNAFLITLKTAVFGETVLDVDCLMAALLTASNAVLAALSLLATVFVSLRALRARDARWLFLSVAWTGVFGAYLLFTLLYPFSCSMDFRYMVPASLCGALMLARAAELFPERSRVGKAYLCLTQAVLAVFAASSVIVYTNLA